MFRLFDLVWSAAGLVVLGPFFLALGAIIKLGDGGPVFYRQLRVGKDGNPFWILKFRTMSATAEANGLPLTVGEDPRITRVGRWLRRWKLDELPQLVNVLLGEMALVGPRPEVPRYVALYTPEQARVLDLRPGITDAASIAYRCESELLDADRDPEAFYVENIMPDKLRINLDYAGRATLWSHCKIILATLGLLRPPVPVRKGAVRRHPKEEITVNGIEVSDHFMHTHGRLGSVLFPSPFPSLPPGAPVQVGLCSRMMDQWSAEFTRSCAALGLNQKTITIGADDWMEQLRGVDVFVWRLTMNDPSCMAEARSKIPLIEAMGIRCFPSQQMLWLFDDKIRETFFLRQHGYPAPRTWVFFEGRAAREFAAGAAYPLVAKTHCGASSTGVVLLRSPREALKLLGRVFRKRSLWDEVLENYYYIPRLAKGDILLQTRASYRKAWPQYAYFQEFLHTDQDWRITTLGRDLVSVFMRRNRPGDFRASGSGLWEKVAPEALPVQACDLALGISNDHGFTSMTYDFMHDGDRWVIGEISYSFLLNAIYANTLFRRRRDGYVAEAAMPIGEMHLRAVLERMPEAADVH